jgi:hypothetical protein
MRIQPGVLLALAIGIEAASCAGRPVTPAPAVAPNAPAAASTPSPVLPAPTAEPPPVVAPAVAAAVTPSPDAFQSDVKPLLLRKCAPCHAPGGQMYARMPFDEPATVREHGAGILRRLKADGAPVERWLAAEAR